MLNQVTIMGRLGKDPELKTTQSGVSVTSFSLAVDRDYNSNGQRETDWIDVVAWRQTAEFACKYFGKGRVMVVAGRLQTRKWKDRDGNTRTAVEVVAEHIYFGDSKRDGDSGSGEYGAGSNSYEDYGGYKPAGEPVPVGFQDFGDDDGECPF